MITLSWAHAKLIIFFLNFMSSTANRVIKNTGFLYAKMGITMFISLYTTRLILNSLGTSDFGIFNIVGGAIAMLGFLNAAMASATQRFMSYSEGEGNKEKQKSIFNVSFVLHLGISFVVGIALLIAGYFFFNGILNIPDDRIFAAKVVYGSLIVSTLFTVMTVPYDAAMNAHENMKYYAIVGVFESFLKLGVAFACVYTTSDKLIVYGSLMASIPLITLTIMRVYCHRHYEECVIAPRTYWNKGLMKEMTSFAGWNFVGIGASMISNYGNNIIVNHFFGVLLNASIGIVTQIQGMIGVLSANMLKALAPVIVKRAGSGNVNEMLKWSYVGMRFGFLLLAVIALPLSIEANFIFTLWLKHVPEWTILFFRLAIIGSLLEHMFGGFSSSLAAIGKIKEFNFYGTITVLFYFSSSFIVLFMGGKAYWIYIMFIIKTIINSSIKVYYCKKYCNLSYIDIVHKLILPLSYVSAVTLICTYIPSLFMEESILRLITALLLGLSSFFLSASSILNKNEKEVLINIKEKIFK